MSIPGIESWEEPAEACDGLSFGCFRPWDIAIWDIVEADGFAGGRNARWRFGGFRAFFPIGIPVPALDPWGDGVSASGAACRALIAALRDDSAIGIFIPGMVPMSCWAAAGAESTAASSKT